MIYYISMLSTTGGKLKFPQKKYYKIIIKLKILAQKKTV